MVFRLPTRSTGFNSWLQIFQTFFVSIRKLALAFIRHTRHRENVLIQTIVLYNVIILWVLGHFKSGSYYGVKF